MRNITSVRYTTLGEVTEEDCLYDGFGGVNILKEGLQKYYPNIDWDTSVTVVRWE